MEENLSNELKEVRMKRIQEVPFLCESPIKELWDVADLLADEWKENGRERLFVLNMAISLHAVNFIELPIEKKGHSTFYIPEIFCGHMLSAMGAVGGIVIFHKHSDDSLELDEYDDDLGDEIYEVAQRLRVSLWDYMLFNSMGDVYSERSGRLIRIKGKKVGMGEAEYDREKEKSTK